MPSPTDAQLLDEAADYMLEHGQCRDLLRDADGKVCMIGAYMMVQNDAKTVFAFSGSPAQYIRAAIFEVTGERRYSIPFWNDRVCRDTEEAAQVLRTAGKLAEADEGLEKPDAPL